MEIDLRKDSCTDKLIKENVDVGQWVLVFDGDGIQRPVVNTVSRIGLSSSQITLGSPKVTNLDGCTLCLIVHSIEPSTRLTPWVSSCMAVRR
jgi:hypothetical protein